MEIFESQISDGQEYNKTNMRKTWFLTSSAIEVTTLLQILQKKKKVFSTFSHRVLLSYWFRYIVIYKTKTEKK